FWFRVHSRSFVSQMALISVHQRKSAAKKGFSCGSAALWLKLFLRVSGGWSGSNQPLSVQNPPSRPFAMCHDICKPQNSIHSQMATIVLVKNETLGPGQPSE